MARLTPRAGVAAADGPPLRLLQDLAGLDVVVATERDASGDLLIRELQRMHGRIRHLWPVPDMLPEAADILFCDLVPDLPMRLPWVPGEPKAALVALLSAGPPNLIVLRNAAPEAVLHRPFTTGAILTSVALARGRFSYERRLRGRIERLDGTLRAMRSVERAKSILMTARNLGEDQAYQFMRNQAMERRVSIGVIATTIVDAHDLLG